VAHVIVFRSARFDPAQERPNPINPIPGESVLRWLRDKLRESRYETTEPEPEDWGWYLDVHGDGASYMVGASGDAGDDATAPVDWTLQIHKHRSMREKITGANKLAADDPLSTLIERLVRQDAAADAVEITRES
jgi:hypothetical protein